MLLICICKLILPKDNAAIIINALISVDEIMVVENIPLIRSNDAFIIVYGTGERFACFVNNTEIKKKKRFVPYIKICNLIDSVIALFNAFGNGSCFMSEEMFCLSWVLFINEIIMLLIIIEHKIFSDIILEFNI